MHKGYQVLVLLLFLGFCSVLAKNWPATSNEWASWVQAVGSVGAILIAIWVSHRDNRNAVDRAVAAEREEGERAAAALAAELIGYWEHYQEVAGSAIERHPDETPFRRYWLPPENPFPMLHGYAGKMHLISNAELRKQLVDTHSSFQTLFSAYKSNNISLEELDEINRLISQKHESAKELGEVVTERMARYSASIKTAHDRTKTATAKVEELLNR